MQVAAPVAVVAALGAGIVRGTGGGLAAGLLVGVVAGGAAYRAVSKTVAGRLELARQTLRQARKRRFDVLTALPGTPDRDELDALIHQVGRAGRTLQSEIERLEQVESYRREFLGDVSHELRTPIFAIVGFAERVRQRFVEKIARNAERLDALTRDLSEISKLETGRLQVVRAPFDLAALAAEVAEGLEHAARDHEVAVAARVPDTLPLVLGDRDRIRQVLTNLVENAVKYNEPGGHVEITARPRDTGDVRITVVDDGIGIPDAALGRLTERFFRVDKSRSRAGGGTGLGLAIVKHILEAHGQRLEVESRVGYGSAFGFALPVAPQGFGAPQNAAPMVVGTSNG